MNNLATLVLLVVLSALSGCAIGSVGTLVANVQRHHTLSVMSLYSIGLHLRNRPEDPGAHLGYSKRVYVFDAREVAPDPGWFFFSAPLPNREAFALDLLTIGVDVSWASPEAGFSLGYAHTRFLARVPLDADVRIDYVGAVPRIDKLLTCKEETVCDLP